MMHIARTRRYISLIYVYVCVCSGCCSAYSVAFCMLSTILCCVQLRNQWPSIYLASRQNSSNLTHIHSFISHHTKHKQGRSHHYHALMDTEAHTLGQQWEVHTDTHTHTDRHTDRQTHRQTDRHTDTHTHTHTQTHTHTHTHTQTHTHTHTHTQTHTHTHRHHTDTHTHAHAHIHIFYYMT